MYGIFLSDHASMYRINPNLQLLKEFRKDLPTTPRGGGHGPKEPVDLIGYPNGCLL